MSTLPPSREGNPLQEPSHDFVIGPPPKRTYANMAPSPERQVHKVYGEDKHHWFVTCVVGRLPKDAPSTEAIESLPLRLPVDTEHCNDCFSTRERLHLRATARARMHSVPDHPNGS